MNQHRRCLMIGAGGMAGNWIRHFLPPFFERMEIVGLVDVNEAVLAEAGTLLKLPESRRLTEMSAAFETVDADFCVIVVPPAFHREAVMGAVGRGMAILSEKPIADTWEASMDVSRAVSAAGVKMAVTQNYRYTAPQLTMRAILRSGDLGRVNYVVGRFAADYRRHGSWGKAFRHEIPHGLLVEGAVHHFDMLRNLAGADCAKLSGWEWNPPWSSSKGEFNAYYVMEMTNGARAAYEGSGTAAGEQNSWHQEAYRAECEGGAVTVGRDRVVRVQRFTRGKGLVIEEIPTVTTPFDSLTRYTGHAWVVDAFLNWLEGGAAPETTIEDNLQTTAMLFGAIEASRTSQVVDVQHFLRDGLGGAAPEHEPGRNGVTLTGAASGAGGA
jgi:predicted dehydrogenase